MKKRTQDSAMLAVGIGPRNETRQRRVRLVLSLTAGCGCDMDAAQPCSAVSDRTSLCCVLFWNSGTALDTITKDNSRYKDYFQVLDDCFVGVYDFCRVIIFCGHRFPAVLS